MNEQYMAPQSRQELFDCLAHMTPGSKIIGGGTDLILHLNQTAAKPDALLYPGFVPGISGVMLSGNVLTVGAMTTMTDLARHPLILQSSAALSDAAAHVGSVQIRNKATIGGNVGNASPAGDLLVPLWLLGATAEIAGPCQTRTVPIGEVLAGIGKTTLAHNEILTAFNWALPPRGTVTAYKKLGSRSEVTISRVGLAVMAAMHNGAVSSINIMLGAVAPTPVRAKTAEHCLLGTSLDEISLTRATQALSDYILQINDRPNRFYKAHASQGVLLDVMAQIKERLQ